MKTVTKEIAAKVLETVDCGLSKGLGKSVPGEMCVEAAVCFAYGLPHSDDPPCVGKAVRAYKINLNDNFTGSPIERAQLMRKLAIAQLGSVNIDQVEFAKRLAEKTIRKLLPPLLRSIGLTSEADMCELAGTESAVVRAAAYAAHAARAAAHAARAAAYAAHAAHAAAYAAHAAADAAAYAAHAAADAAAYAADAAAYAAHAARAYAARADAGYLQLSADLALEVLIEMKSPGCEYLYLCE